MLLYTWEASGWEAARSELTGQQGNHQPPKVHKKVRASCHAVLCLFFSLFSEGIKHKPESCHLNHILACLPDLDYIFFVCLVST